MLNERQTIKGLKNPIMTVATFVVLLLAFNPDWGGSSLLWWVCVALFIFVFLITQRELFINSGYVMWTIVFLVYCTVSCFWAVSTSLAINALKNMMVKALLLIILSSILRTKADIERLLKIIVLICSINAIYLLVENVDMLFGGDIGNRLGTEGDWNANTIGMMMAFASIVLVYLMERQKSKIYKFLCVMLILFLVFVSFVTGSRKAFLMVIAGLSAFLILSANKKIKWLVFLIICGVSVGVYSLVMSEPYLYSVLGRRLEGLMASIIGVGTVDGSTETRELYIKVGIQVFEDNFLVGCGLDCFRVLNRNISGDAMYAHNNYVEILADLGILGALIYYWMYVIILSRLFKKLRNGGLLTKLFIVLMGLLIILDYGCVSYNSYLFQILILISFNWLNICKNDL